MIYAELAAVAVLIVFNGVLAMAELAVVSARRGRLQSLIDRGVVGSRRALALANDPGRFLSAVQIGITLVGVLSGAFSGATLGVRLGSFIESFGVSPAIANYAGVGLVVALITYVSLIIGELVPKQIALRDAEGVAVRVAPAMTLLARSVRRWSGCSTCPAMPCFACSATGPRKRKGSATRRYGC
jgi:putative hemolysin